MAPTNRLGTLIIFHLRQDGKPLSHGVSFTGFPYPDLSCSQIAILAEHDRRLLGSGTLIELVGSFPATFSEYQTAHDTGDIKPYCPLCNPTTKGTANE